MCIRDRFSSRKQLLKVPRLGAKAFEQCAGFLRIPGAADVLDASAVHPEAYPLVQRIAADLGAGLNELIGNEKMLQQVDAKKYIDAKFGAHTIHDLIQELKKPGLCLLYTSRCV